MASLLRPAPLALRVRSALLALCLAGLAAGCAPKGDATPAATLDGRPITLAELDAWIKDELWNQATEDGNASKVHELRSQALESMINQRLVEEAARTRGTDAETLLRQEGEARAEVDDAAMQQFYAENRERMGGRSFEDTQEQIRAHLERRQRSNATRDFVRELREQASVEVLLEQPPVERIQVAAEGPARGPADAPITIVEFSDYECPYCKRAEPVVEEVMERYPGKIRFVYRHFPLGMHPLARGAAEGAVCADQQGLFWEFHARLFADGAELAPEGLAAIASEIGLDQEAWQACLADAGTQAKVESDIAAGRAAGVTGTPAFFVNGIPLKGAQPAEEFSRVIDGELAGQG